MAKHGKKYIDALKKLDETRSGITPRKQLGWSSKPRSTKFDATVEVHMRLGVDPRHADQQVRDVVVLPHGLGKSVRVVAFAQGEGATLAREAGADFVADDEFIAKVQGWLDWI